MGVECDKKVDALIVGSETTTSLASPKVASSGVFSNQTTGRSFMSNVMDTLLLKNTTFRSNRVKTVEPGVHNSPQVIFICVFVGLIRIILCIFLQFNDSLGC